MQPYSWSCLLLLLAVSVNSALQNDDSVNDDRILWLRPPSFTHNWRYNPFMIDNDSDSSESESMESEIESETFQVPKKRNLSLLSWWKTLEQLRRNNSPRFLAARSDNVKPKKVVKPAEEIVEMPEISKDIITAVSRGYRRTLRPPGQPLRFG